MRIKTTLTAVALGLTVMLNGCSSTGGESADLDKVSPTLKKDNAVFFSQSGAGACAVGALTGVAACLLSDVDDKIACALIAAFGGCAVAMTANYALDKIRSDYHNLEDQLDATKDIVQKDLDTTKNLEANVNETLKGDEEEVARIEQNIKDGKMNVSALEKKAEEMENNNNFIKTNIAVAQQHLSDYKKAAEEFRSISSNGTQEQKEKQIELDAKVEETQNTINSLLESSAAYAANTAHVKQRVREISGS
ncbi:MAG: hypothetical protein GX278_05245 [Aeromonadales bacterium]|nr:hypothetical protein [Aeromonadales bacterium]